MTTVRKILDEKPDRKIYTVPSDATVLDAPDAMAEANTGAVLVTEDEKIVGIFTERDYARGGELKGRFAKDTIVGDVMTRQMVMGQARNHVGGMRRIDGQVSRPPPARN